jgi:transcriptional regulator with XRE-family HTH domain
VTIGETLAEARLQAGLTVSQVSQQTRIRESIIRGIEQDDYSGCGGDFYARGHIRAVARAVGTDPAPLIREFDANNRILHGPEASLDASGNVRVSQSPDDPGAAPHPPNVFQPIPRGGSPDATGQPTATGQPGATGQPDRSAPAGPPRGRPDTSYWLPSVFDAVDQVPRGPGADRVASQPPPRQPSPTPRPPRPAPRSYQPPRPSREPGADASWLSSVFDSAPERPGETTEPNGVRPAVAVSGAGRPPKRENRVAIIAVATLAVIGLLAFLLANVFSSGSPKPRAAATSSPSNQHKASSSPGPTPSHSASAPATPALAPRALRPASAMAFGPGGVGHGDDPQRAGLAIDASLRSAWTSDWYSTPHFGNLQSGTGLLLDMGRTVTIDRATIRLGTPGADLQLRAGSAASLAALRPVAHASNAGGVVQLRVSSPVHARYVLVWFTSLPPDATGTYQAKIYNIVLWGTG